MNNIYVEKVNKILLPTKEKVGFKACLCTIRTISKWHHLHNQESNLLDFHL